jgi:hypothetical protein
MSVRSVLVVIAAGVIASSAVPASQAPAAGNATAPPSAGQRPQGDARGGRGGFTSAPADPAKHLFHEAWTRGPMAQPMRQQDLGNKHLTLHIYGNPDEIRKTFHPDEDYTYTGETTTNWALTVSDESAYWDLTGDARIRLKTRNSGYRFLHVVIKTADGRYYVSEEGSGESTAWIETDYVFIDLRWRNLLMTDTPTNASNRRAPDPKRVPIIPTSRGVPDLSKVEEVGFSDLMPGGWIPSTSRVKSFDLWGKTIPRAN